MKTKQQSTEEKRTSTPKTTRHTSPQERTRTDKHLNKNSKTEGSRRVQIQFKFKFKTTSNQFPRTCNKQTCYDPQLQGCLIWQCHLSDPFGSYIIGSSLYLSSSYLQKRSRQVQNVARPFQKQSSETVDKLNCKTMTTVKTVANRVQ